MTTLPTFESTREASSLAREEFETTDLYLGCYLKVRGLRLLGARHEGRRTVFIFEDSGQRLQWTQEFYNEGIVRVNDFKNAVQDLKSIIYNT